MRAGVSLFARRIGARLPWGPWLYAVALAMLGMFVSCRETSEPTSECESVVGDNFIALQPEPREAIAGYEINVGDSIQLVGSVRRIDIARRTFNVQQGWYCVVAASSLVSGLVILNTTDSHLVRLSGGGWVHGLSPGLATITAASTNPPATVDVGVLVIAP